MKGIYDTQNVVPVLQKSLVSKYTGLSAILASSGSGTAARLLLIQQVLEFIIEHEVRRMLAGYPFTIGIMLSYFFLKKKEIQTIMTMLNAKIYALSEQQLEGIL